MTIQSTDVRLLGLRQRNPGGRLVSGQTRRTYRKLMPSLGSEMLHGGQDWDELVTVKNDHPPAVPRCHGFFTASFKAVY